MPNTTDLLQRQDRLVEGFLPILRANDLRSNSDVPSTAILSAVRFVISGDSAV